MFSRFSQRVIHFSISRLGKLAVWVAFLGCFLAAAQNTEDSQQKKIVAQSKAGTVFIKAKAGSGTGFIFKKVGNHYYVATNLHILIADKFLFIKVLDKTPTVVTHSGTPQEKTFLSDLVSYSHLEDIAILRIECKDQELTVLPLPQSYDYVETTPIFSIGFPFGDSLGDGGHPAPTIQSGNISSLRHHPQSKALKLIQLDTNLNPGNSGGPILTNQGQVIGMAVSTVLGTDISFAIPLPIIQTVLSGTIGGYEPGNHEFDHRQKFALVTYTLVLADPFNNLEEVGFTQLHQEPTKEELNAPFRHLPGTSWRFNLAEKPPVFKARRAIHDGKLTWYQFFIKRKGQAEREFLAPFYFTEDPHLPFIPDSPLRPVEPEPKPKLPPPMASLPENLDPHLALPLDRTWIDELHKRIKKPKTLALPSFPQQILPAGGERYLLFSFPEINCIGVFDFALAEFSHFFHLKEPFLFAAGGHHILFYFPTGSRCETYDLSTLEKVNEGKIAFRGTPLGMMMGRDHSYRAIIYSHDPIKRMGHLDLMDTTTYESVPLFVENPYRTNSFENGSTNSKATAFVFNGDRYDFVENDQLVRNFSYSDRRLHHWTDQNFLVTQGGSILDRENARRKDSLSGLSFPSKQGRLYLNLVRPFGDKKDFTLTINAFGDNETVLNTGLELNHLEYLKSNISSFPSPLLYFSETANYIAVLDPIRNRFQVHPFHVEKELAKLGKRYLFLGSRPESTVNPAQGFSYQILPISNSKNLIFRLITKPDGMEISPEGLITWQLVEAMQKGTHPVEVLIIAGDDLMATQTFTLNVR